MRSSSLFRSKVIGSIVVLISGFGIWSLTYHGIHASAPDWLVAGSLMKEAVKASSFSHPLVIALDGPQHPINVLHNRAVRKLDFMLKRQSKTLDQAINEYRMRYNRNPPPGFDKWYLFARQYDSTIIDEFDMISNAMRPFWNIRPRDFEGIVQSAADGPDLWMLGIQNGSAIFSEGDWMSREISEIIKDAIVDIPDIKLLLNPLDEPRVVWSKGRGMGQVQWSDQSKTPVWDIISKPCSAISGRKGHQASSTIETLPFVIDREAAIDVCQNPGFQTSHAFAFAPPSLISTESPVPILSQAAPSTFSDLLYPSMWYWDNGMDDLDDYDLDWFNKSNKLYWAGSTTGPYTQERHYTNKQRSQGQRHRFIEMTKQLLPGRVYRFLTRRKETGSWTPYESDEILGQLYDTKFTRVVQCEDLACKWMEQYYHVAKPQDKHEALKFRFMMDIDGNSFSGRFYNLLASQGCVLKQTIFREWHDERLIPWVHYVPISTSMEELPEVMRFLALTTEGNDIAKAIADKGREARTMLRKEDAAIYLYRLFLEFARVSTEGRDDRMLDSRV